MSEPELKRIQPLFIPREGVLKYFPPLLEVDKVMKHSDGEMDSTGLLGALLSGQMEFWRWEGGWAITAVWGSWLDIVGMYDETWGRGSEAMDFFQRVSKYRKLRGIRSLNARKGAARRAEQWGFKVRLIEYVRENSSNG